MYCSDLDITEIYLQNKKTYQSSANYLCKIVGWNGNMELSHLAILFFIKNLQYHFDTIRRAAYA